MLPEHFRVSVAGREQGLSQIARLGEEMRSESVARNVLWDLVESSRFPVSSATVLNLALGAF